MKCTERLTAVLMAVVLCLQTAVPSLAEVRYSADSVSQEPENGTFLVEERAYQPFLPPAAFSHPLSAPALLSLKAADVSGEDVSRRGRDAKVFMLGPSGGVSATYGSRVHKKSPDGNWDDIDNTLVPTQDSYSLRDGAFELRLPETAGSGESVLSENGYTLSWHWEEISASRAKILDATDQALLDNPFYLPKLTSKLSYENTYAYADLLVTVTTVGVKEDVILKSPEAPFSYTISLDIGSLHAKQNGTHTVSLYDAEGREVYRVAAPCMTDADGESSESVSLILSEANGTRLVLDLSGDREWLSAPERVYPVTLDPYIYTVTDEDSIADTYITSAFPNQTYGGMGSFFIGRESIYGICRALIRFDLPELSKGDTVVGAVLSLTQYAPAVSPIDASPELDVYRAAASWGSLSATWNTKRSNYDSSRLYDMTTATNASSIQSFYLTELVKSWYNGTETNNGIFLKWQGDESGAYTRVRYFSSDYAGLSHYFPVIMISFLSDVGQEEYRSYRSASADYAGTAFVNDYSGNLSFTAPLSETDGLLLPVGTFLTYNGYLSGEESLNGKRGLTAGYGWTLNLSSRIDPLQTGGTSTDEQALFDTVYQDSAASYRYVFRDADATVHYLYEDGTEYKDEEGLGLSLKLASVSVTEHYRLDYQDGSCSVFDADGYLTRSYDAEGNYLSVSYASAGSGSTLRKFVTAVTDGAGRVTSLSHDANGRLTSVTTPDGRTTTLSYTGDRLSSVNYPNGLATTFSYDGEGRLSRVENRDGRGLSISYRSGSALPLCEKNRVIRLQEFASDDTPGNYIDFSYRSDQTTVFTYSVNGGEVSEQSAFDYYGRTVSVTNLLSGAASDYRYTNPSSPDGSTNRLSSVSVKGETGDPANLLENSVWSDAASGIPSQWSAGGLESGDGLSGGAFRLTAVPYGLKGFYQDVPIGHAGAGFLLSVKVEGHTLPSRPDEPDRTAALSLTFYYSDGTTETVGENLNFDTAGIQYKSLAARPSEANAEKLITKVRYQISYGYTRGTLSFSDCELLSDESGSAFGYDSEGNLVSASRLAEEGKIYSYSSAGELIEASRSGSSLSEHYTYTYDVTRPHRLTAARSEESGLGLIFTYNDKGEVTETKVGAVRSDGSPDPAAAYLSVSTVYTSDKNYIASSTTQSGAAVSYERNAQGLVTKQTDPEGNETLYSYDAQKRLLRAVSTGDASVSYSYDADDLSLARITHNGFDYEFSYDRFGNLASVRAGGQTLLTNTYLPNNGSLQKLTYGNGDEISYSYDRLGRLSSESYVYDVFSYRYDTHGNLSAVLNGGTPEAEYFYDLADHLSVFRSGELTVSFEYDSLNRVTETVYSLFDSAYRYLATYGPDSRLESVSLVGGPELCYTYDSLSRVTKTELTAGSDLISETDYAYRDLSSSRTTTQVSAMVNKNADGDTLSSFSYTYDGNGNLVTVADGNGVTTVYTYDSLNRLTASETDTERREYDYDDGGNITEKRCYGRSGSSWVLYDSDSCSYEGNGWNDLLTEYNGSLITYDEIGNPVCYLRNSEFYWQGRRLSGFYNGVTFAAYTYNADGIRTSKNVDEVLTTYYLEGSRITGMVSDDTLWSFLYYRDTLIGFETGGERYYYLRNLQGDVIQIIDEDGEVVVYYTYDDWGKITDCGGILSGTLGWQNPFRYRGYVYDEETGLYYVSSRYYDPEVGRFISPDTVAILAATPMGLTDKNLYAYCDNNPVCRVDYGGYFWDTVFDVVSLCFSVAEVVANPADPWAWAGLAGDIIDLVPFVTGVGEMTKTVGATVKVANALDNTVDTIKIVKAVDFPDDALDTIRALDKVGDATKSTAEAGRRIHQGYKIGDGFRSVCKEYDKLKGFRPDYIDFTNNIIYELKPMNSRGIRSGIKQLQRYDKAFGGGFTLILELY